MPRAKKIVDLLPPSFVVRAGYFDGVVADRLRAEFDAYRARPWWRRLTRSAA
jgi:hypothetical protein